MDLDGFWRLIEESGTHYRQRAMRLKWLEMRLEELPADEIVDFHILLHTHRERVDTQAMWGAAHHVCDGIGGDDFWYFQFWLFSLGRAAFEHAAAAPDNLADLAGIRRLTTWPKAEWDGDRRPEWEGLSWVARYAYCEATGVPRDGDAIEKDLEARGYDTAADPAEPGDWWNLDDPAEARRRYPRLAELFPRDGTHRLLVPEDEPFPAAAEPSWHAYTSDGSSWMDPPPEVLAVFVEDLHDEGDWLVLNRIGGNAGYVRVSRTDRGMVAVLRQADQPVEVGWCDSERTALAVLRAWASGATGWPRGVAWESVDPTA